MGHGDHDHARPKGRTTAASWSLAKEEYHAEVVHDDASGDRDQSTCSGTVIGQEGVTTDGPHVTINSSNRDKPGGQFQLPARPRHGRPPRGACSRVVPTTRS